MSTDPEARLASYARASVRFAMDNGPLLALMWGTKADGSTGSAAEAARRFLTSGATLLGEEPGAAPSTLPFLVAVTLEGVGAPAAAGRIPADRVDEVVDAAVTALLPSLTARLGTPGTGR